MAFFQFFPPPSWKIDLSIFFLVPTRKKIMIFDQSLQKNSSKSIKLLLHNILWCFRQIGKWNFHNFNNKKLVLSIFVTNRFEKY